MHCLNAWRRLPRDKPGHLLSGKNARATSFSSLDRPPCRRVNIIIDEKLCQIFPRKTPSVAALAKNVALRYTSNT